MKYERKIPTDFSVSISLPQATHNPNITKARARIFYKGPNRNGSFITPEFAQKLMSTINYIPVKGIYEGGFLSHGDVKTQGRAYGVVPKEHNFSWERHVDVDGVEREYATVDVYLWDLYRESQEIIDSSQSMELDENSIDGEWVVVEGQQYFKFTDASFIGLQVLGKDFEPCFEGSSFFSKNSDIVDFIKNVVAVEMAMYSNGGNTVDENKEKVESTQPDFQEAPEVNEPKEGAEQVERVEEVEEVEEFEEIEEENVEPVEEEGEMEDFTLPEEEVEEENISEDSQKNEEDNEKTTLEAEVRGLRAENEELKAELHTLKEYQIAAEGEKKEAVFAKYADLLSEEVVSNYRDKADDYTVSELERELAYELVQSRTDVFSNNVQVVPHEETHGHESGVEAILKKHRSKTKK